MCSSSLSLSLCLPSLTLSISFSLCPLAFLSGVRGGFGGGAGVSTDYGDFNVFCGSGSGTRGYPAHPSGTRAPGTRIPRVRVRIANYLPVRIRIPSKIRNMFSAGTDTSSSTVEWIVAELIRHPKIMTRAQQELDSVVGRSRLVSESDLPNLPYLQAVIKENFRLHPPTPLSLPHIASESCEINGYYIPKGSTLLTNIWAIARDPDQWSDPLEFQPERFLPGGEKPHVDVKGNDFELIPFGAGRRICAGLSLGLRMIQLLTATVVHAFDWELVGGVTPLDLNMDEAYGITLQRVVPLVVHPKPRLSPSVYGTGSN